MFAVPGLIGQSLLLSRFRMTPQGRRGRPTLPRIAVGLLLAGAFVLTVLGLVDGWAYLQRLSLVAPLGTFVTAGGTAFARIRTTLPATLIAVLTFGLLGLVYQLKQLMKSEVVRVQQPRPLPNPERLAQRLQALKQRDPGFSRVAFLDFVQALYHGANGWLGTPEHDHLAAYVGPDVLGAIKHEAGRGGRASAIVLGAMRLEAVELAEGADSNDAITVELEGNYTRDRDGVEPVRLVVRERWRLERAGTATSPPPARMRVLSCAACGAALSVSKLGACSYCNTKLDDGRLQWRLVRRAPLSVETFATDGLGETTPEEGTSFETVVDPGLATEGAALAQAEGQRDLASFTTLFRRDTVEPIFRQMYAAWSTKKWNDVRHLLTDFLWEAQQLWVRAYADKGLTNKLDDLALTDMEVVRVERDRDFDAVTVRLHATCRDYTVDRANKVIGGDARRPRVFSEYWTFLRGTGAKPGPIKATEPRCPNCGAPIDKMGATGVCGYCKAKVTTGDFGWVLATITQDEVYVG
jgi:predicted lipid-binding transport protein (Tim44 family)